MQLPYLIMSKLWGPSGSIMNWKGISKLWEEFHDIGTTVRVIWLLGDIRVDYFPKEITVSFVHVFGSPLILQIVFN